MLDRVLEMQAQGKTMKQIAAELGVGYSTLYKHLDGEKPKAPKAPKVPSRKSHWRFESRSRLKRTTFRIQKTRINPAWEFLSRAVWTRGPFWE